MGVKVGLKQALKQATAKVEKKAITSTPKEGGPVKLWTPAIVQSLKANFGDTFTVTPPLKPRVDLPDPALPTSTTGAMNGVTVSPIAGAELFIDGVNDTDPMQAKLGDCYLVSSMASVAHARPDLIQAAFKKNDDGTYAVRIFTEDPKTRAPVATWVNVDDDLPKRAALGPSQFYGDARTLQFTGGKNEKELWPALYEKAFATQAGGYEKIIGGIPGEAMFAITGSKTKMIPAVAAYTFDSIKAAVAAKQPVVASTKELDDTAAFTNSGLYPSHAYSVFGTSEENGQKFVTLRNPWGKQVKETPIDAEQGIFKVPLEQFGKMFGFVEILNVPPASPAQ